MDKLDKYFIKCIQDAYRSEEREYKEDQVKWYYVAAGNQILFSINTPFQRVSRKAVRRIQNNIEKNFGFKTDGDYFLDTILQPNSVCNHFTVYGKDLYLCKKIDYETMQKGEVIPCARYEKLCMAYHNVSLDEYRNQYDLLRLPDKNDWEEYRKTYYKAFGEYPEVVVEALSNFSDILYCYLLP